MSNLEQESGLTAYALTDEQIEIFWKYLGGSMFEISYALGELITHAKKKSVDKETIKKEIDRLITINCGKIEYYVKLNKQKFQLFKQILSIQDKKQFFFSKRIA